MTLISELGVTAFGAQLRQWRQRRSRSQLALALEADISQRHLSFLESGRAMPSREMLLHLAERLEIPLRDRNVMLLAAGFAPAFRARTLEDPAMSAVREAVSMVLKAHEPFPALAIDAKWNLVLANAAVTPLLAGIEDPGLLEAPVNVLRLSLHPKGLAPRIANLPEWRRHLLHRLGQQIAATGDTDLDGLLDELQSYPGSAAIRSVLPGISPDPAGIFVPLRLASKDGLLSFFSTTTVFGTPLDVTMSELAIEAFFPADDETRLRITGSAVL
jgi:transcriptional regulator with XRE-family HTH domain